MKNYAAGWFFKENIVIPVILNENTYYKVFDQGGYFFIMFQFIFFYKFLLDKMHYGKEKIEIEAPSASCSSIIWSFRSSMLLRFLVPLGVLLSEISGKTNAQNRFSGNYYTEIVKKDISFFLQMFFYIAYVDL